ncbi:MAG: IgGFc-binding protein [Myxococcales bacterium]|nr:IgGFc-binding protein [Myxococcales bacterium]
MRLVGVTKWVSGAAMLAAAGGLFSGGCSASSGSGSGVNNGGNGGNGGSGNNGGTGGDGFGAFGGSGGQIDGGGGSGGNSGGIPESCAQAQAQKSYLGCEYWPTVTNNAGLDDGFEFAVVAANPTKSNADVTVEFQGQVLATRTIAPGQLDTIRLPWVTALKQTFPNFTSGLVQAGAFHVTSSVPITLYQFNPLEFERPGDANCPAPCNSFTNDASLLIPTTALGSDYYVMSYPTHHVGQGPTGLGPSQWNDAPGFLAVTATEDGTDVTVNSSAYVRSGNGVSALSPGQQGTYSLNRGDVLVLSSGVMPEQKTPQPNKPCGTEVTGLGSEATLCPSPKEYDLTGSRITSNKPISVIGGHDCTFVPYSRFACDHLEESMFPTETLGQDLVVTAPQAVASIQSNPGQADNMFVRVMSAADGNKIDFEPAVNPSVTLNAGEWVEIGPITSDFRIQSDNRVMVSQYMVGENFSGQSAGAGDPSLSIAIPVEQYRLEYTFLAPTTYTYNFVNVVAPPGAVISIDGAPIDQSRFTPIGNSGFNVARVQVPGGAHAMKGDKNFGIVVYGYASYTSYMYPGGLNLEKVEIVPR